MYNDAIVFQPYAKAVYRKYKSAKEITLPRIFLPVTDDGHIVPGRLKKTIVDIAIAIRAAVTDEFADPSKIMEVANIHFYIDDCSITATLKSYREILRQSIMAYIIERFASYSDMDVIEIPGEVSHDFIQVREKMCQIFEEDTENHYLLYPDILIDEMRHIKVEYIKKEKTGT